MDGERVVFTEETDPQTYVELIASGFVDDSLLEALEDLLKLGKMTRPPTEAAYARSLTKAGAKSAEEEGQEVAHTRCHQALRIADDVLWTSQPATTTTTPTIAAPQPKSPPAPNNPRTRALIFIKNVLIVALASNIVIDTAQAATDTIDYVATDQSGLTATSTRTVIIQPAAISPSPQSGQGSATETATSTDTSTTDATSTANSATRTSPKRDVDLDRSPTVL